MPNPASANPPKNSLPSDIPLAAFPELSDADADAVLVPPPVLLGPLLAAPVTICVLVEGSAPSADLVFTSVEVIAVG
jgi:hypothetical protein